MERFPPKPMTPLDELVTPPSLYTMKLLLPYMPSSLQRTLAIFVKFFEFRQTMEMFYGFGNTGKPISSAAIFNDLKPYMNPKEQEMMEQMEMLMNMMEMMQGQPDMPDMSDFLGGMFGDMPHAPDSGTQNDVQKGDDTDE